ncbi:hypothetical protein D9M72_640410 [compost metagenome]
MVNFVSSISFVNVFISALAPTSKKNEFFLIVANEAGFRLFISFSELSAVPLLPSAFVFPVLASLKRPNPKRE